MKVIIPDKLHENATQILEKAGIMNLFETRFDGIVSRKHKLKGKPEPDIFKKACDNRTVICYVRHNFDPLRRIACVFRKHLEHLEKVKAEYKGPMLILQYEQFWNDYDYIFNKFADCLTIFCFIHFCHRGLFFKSEYNGGFG